MSVAMLPLAHGYTLGDLGELTRVAVHSLGPMGMDIRDRYDLAYSAVCEHLYAADEPPRRGDLITAGRQGIRAAVTATVRQYGYYERGNSWTSHGVGSSPAFQAWWRPAVADPPEDRIVDRLTLVSVMAALPEQHRQALALRSSAGVAELAELWGVTEIRARRRVSEARARALALWFDAELPPARRRGEHGMRRRTERAPCGTSRGYRQHLYRRERTCDDCRAANSAEVRGTR